jgi:hypothetical protein
MTPVRQRQKSSSSAKAGGESATWCRFRLSCGEREKPALEGVLTGRIHQNEQCVTAHVTSAGGPECFILFQELGGERNEQDQIGVAENPSPFPHQNSVSRYKTCNNQEIEGVKEVSFEKKKVTRLVITKRLRGVKEVSFEKKKVLGFSFL